MNKKNEFDFINSFPPLGHPEHHFNRYPNHPWLKNKDDIDGWLRKNVADYNDNFEIKDDLTIYHSQFADELFVTSKDEFLPVQFIDCASFYCADGANLKSLIGSPYVASELSVEANIESFEGLSPNIADVCLSRNKIKNFKHMPNGIYTLNVVDNPIESWDGFTECIDLWVWLSSWENKDELEVLLNAPLDKVGSLTVPVFLKDSLKDEVVLTKGGQIDLNWLKEERWKKKMEGLKSEIDLELNSRSENSKKRKL